VQHLLVALDRREVLNLDALREALDDRILNQGHRVGRPDDRNAQRVIQILFRRLFDVADARLDVVEPPARVVGHVVAGHHHVVVVDRFGGGRDQHGEAVVVEVVHQFVREGRVDDAAVQGLAGCAAGHVRAAGQDDRLVVSQVVDHVARLGQAAARAQHDFDARLRRAAQGPAVFLGQPAAAVEQRAVEIQCDHAVLHGTRRV